MARQVTTVVTCDACATENTPADETFQFAWSGTAYDIDLCTAHGKEMSEGFAPWIGFARRSDSFRGGRSRATRASRSNNGTGARDLKSVRMWAKSNGYTLGDRGRIPREVIDAYEKANA